MLPYYIDYSEIEKITSFRSGRRNRSEPPDRRLKPLSDSLPGNLFDRDFYSIAEERYIQKQCIYCNQPLIIDNNFSLNLVKHVDEDTAYLGSTYTINETLLYCPECYWWVFNGATDDYTHGGEGSEGRDFKLNELFAMGKIKTFDLKEEQVPLVELRSWLARHPNNVAHTNPHAFEKLMADCFKDLYPESEVIHVGKKSSDNGVDIKVVLNNKEHILIQVKRRERLDSSEGVKTVRELNGVLFKHGIAKGMVVTTAKKFTPAAIRETIIAPNVIETELFQKYKVDLLAYSDIIDLLKIEKKKNILPWQNHASAFQDIPMREEFLKL